MSVNKEIILVEAIAPVPKPVSPWKNFIAGGTGGMCLVFAGHPLDTIKVRLQAMATTTVASTASNLKTVDLPNYNGAFDCIKRTFVNEGVRGFYKGMGTPLVMVTPLFAIQFFGYGVGQKIVTHVSGSQADGTLSPGQLFCSGAISGTVMSTIVAPVERIKCLLQVQVQEGAVKKYNGPLHCGITLIKEGGLPSFFRGFGATFIRAIPQSGLYFMTYDCIKRYFNARDKTTSLSTAKTLVAGGLTGLVNWSLVLPLDVVKSRIQTAPEGTYPRGFRDALPQLLKSEGVKGLYRGIVPVFIRAFPANAACFMGFETALKVINWFENE